MKREEFHRIYSQMPEDFKAELIGGIVYVASPLRNTHGESHASFSAVLVIYKASTPGVAVADNATVILDDEAEPQPDLFLRLLPELGGNSKTNSDDYVVGAPELVAEIALSSRAIDLHDKLLDYKRNGVVEYLVASVHERKLYWFNLREDKELSLDSDGVCRSFTFPGLWIDSTALFTGDDARLIATLQRGLATTEHVEFVARLAAAKR